MSLLSDRQIKKLCTPPTFMVTERINNARVTTNGMTHDIFILPTQKEYLTNITEKEILAKPTSTMTSVCGVVSYRPATEEEIDAYVPMISPFIDHQVRNDENGNKLISYGVSSSGYDLRIAPEFKIFTNMYSAVVDPKNFDSSSFIDFIGPEVIIPPNSFVLGRSIERFSIPRDVCAIVVGKSTLARVGINCLCTPLENSWEGYLTLEFANMTPLPVKLYANEGGCQILFFRNELPPDVSYSDRNGKYSNQGAEIILPRV